jgi:hypothetical protein
VAIFRTLISWHSRALLCAVLLACTPIAVAAPGFIAGSFVDGDEETARMSVQFRCNVEYVGHDPATRGDHLRIRLEATRFCTGVSPNIANNREQHRPIGADAAKLISLEYDGDSPAGQILRFNFSEEVRFDLVRSVNDNTITVHINGQTWHRIRIGYFDTAEDASRVLHSIRSQYPTAWIDRVAKGDSTVNLEQPVVVATGSAAADEEAVQPSAADAKTVHLLEDARRSMISGELSRAIQIYTKILQLPPNEFQRDAQEYLALARERNGQLAHAKAEYQRYLSVYPDSDGADRVSQRLASLLASSAPDPARPASAAGTSRRGSSADSPWTVRTFASQFYRRDANQMNDQDEVVSQSSVYSDVSIDARRRGERFDFSTRLTGMTFACRTPMLISPTHRHGCAVDSAARLATPVACWVDLMA